MLDNKIFTFLKVAQLKNYTKAAAELNLTQPAVTQHIKKLEAYYGCNLINFNGKAITLTSQGESLYNYANFQIANEKQLINQIHKTESPIKIGATLSIADYYLPSYLSSYLRHSNNLFSLTVRNTKSIIEMLLSNDLYCAFIEGIFDKSLFNYYEFCNTKFLPVARRNHPLEGIIAKLPIIHKYPLILRERGSGTREIYENYLYQNNDSLLSAAKIYEISSFDTLTGLYNRATFDKVAKEIVRPEALSVVILDINDFKHVNDTYGHNYGDKVIKIMASVIRETFNKHYKCYRYGGDEFAISTLSQTIYK